MHKGTSGKDKARGKTSKRKKEQEESGSDMDMSGEQDLLDYDDHDLDYEDFKESLAKSDKSVEDLETVDDLLSNFDLTNPEDVERLEEMATEKE